MKKKAIFFSKLLVIGFLVLFALPSFGQNALPIDELIPTMTDAPDRKKSILSATEQTAKDLYEQAYNISLTESEFRQKCGSSPANISEWQTVLSTFANTTVDVSIVQDIVTMMTQKISN